jgi:urate oxidase
MLRIGRHGDRDDPRELTVGVVFEGDFAEAFQSGRPETLPRSALARIVHASARDYGDAEIETFGLGLCDRLLAAHPRIVRLKVEIAERAWARLDAGGRPQGRAFTAGSPDANTVAVTSNGTQVSVVAGVADLSLMRTTGFSQAGDAQGNGADDGLQRLLVGTLAARWTYTSGDVAFRPSRRGVRAALIDTFAWHESRSVEHVLYAMGEVVLASYEEIADVTLELQERVYSPTDLFTAGLENPEDLFVALDQPLGVTEVRVER